MATSLHSIANLEAEKIVVIGGHELHVLYHPFKLSTNSAKKYEHLLAEGNIEQHMEHIIKTLLHIVASWDLSLDEEGTEIVPLEHEQLERLPLLLLQQIFNEIVLNLGI